jgi:putative protein kinase ArgK-like GTPase of G3E family
MQIYDIKNLGQNFLDLTGVSDILNINKQDNNKSDKTCKMYKKYA